MINIIMQLKPAPGHDGCAAPHAAVSELDPAALAEGGPEAEPAAPCPLVSEAGAVALPGEDPRLVKAQTRITALESQEIEQKERHHRLLADFANHRNRTGQETRLAATLAEKKVLLEMLPILDSLDRCVAANYPTVDAFRTGVSLIQKQFMEALRKAEVEAVEFKIGDPFDAEQAEAITTTSHLGLPDGAVAAVFERGYRLRQGLLRPARVIVNQIPRED